MLQYIYSLPQSNSHRYMDETHTHTHTHAHAHAHTHTHTHTCILNLNVILLQVTRHKTGHIAPATLVFDPPLWREIERFITKIRPLIPNLQDGLRNVFVTFPSTDNGTPSPMTSLGINKALQRVWGEKVTATRLRKATATNVSHEAHLN